LGRPGPPLPNKEKEKRKKKRFALLICWHVTPSQNFQTLELAAGSVRKLNFPNKPTITWHALHLLQILTRISFFGWHAFTVCVDFIWISLTSTRGEVLVN
jgi:hypothetical protein